jgi:ParB family transcriptional regulator, chromosome partitioning protein
VSKTNKGLGRGLGSLIPDNFDNSIMADEKDRVKVVLIDDVYPNPDQPRKDFDKTSLDELSLSIKTYGILQPLVVTVQDEGKHKIIAGERRWRAAKQAGLKNVPTIVRSSKELEQLEIALVENVQRVDLSPLEQAQSIERLHDQFSMSYEQIAKRLGKAPSTVNNILRLLQLPKEAKEALSQHRITEGHARSILAIKDYPEQQKELLDNILRKSWSVRQAEQFAVQVKKGAKSNAKQKVMSVSSPGTDKLAKKLDTNVNIRRTARGGKLEISFKSDEDLERILRELTQN